MVTFEMFKFGFRLLKDTIPNAEILKGKKSWKRNSGKSNLNLFKRNVFTFLKGI